MSKETRLSGARLAAFCGPATVIGGLGIPLGVYLPAYYSGYLGVDLGAVGIAFALVQLIAISFDPVVGFGIDATRTRWGRFRPWTLAAAPVFVLSTYTVFMARPGVSALYLVLWQLLMYFGLSMSMMATNAWAAALVPDYHRRSHVYAWVQVLGFGGALACLVLPAITAAFGHPDEGSVVHAMGWLVIVIAPLTALLAIGFVGEPAGLTVAASERIGVREYLSLARHPAMMRLIAANIFLYSAPSLTGALYFFFFQQARGYSFEEATNLLLIYIATGLILPLWARIAERIGKHRTMMTAAGMNAAGQCALLAIPSHQFWVMAFLMLVTGFAANSYSLLFNAMVADVSDEVRLATKMNRTAPLFALSTVSAKIGTAIPLMIVFPILKAVGFNAAPGAVNTPAAIHGLESCFVLAPVLAIVAGGACLIGYHLNAERHGEIRRELDVFDELAAGLASDSLQVPAARLVMPVEHDQPSE